jgi:hypothetical protein
MCELRISDRDFKSTHLQYCAVLCCAMICCASVQSTHHDFLLALDGRHVAREREEDLTHVSSVVKICEGLEQGHHTQQLPVS